MNAKLTKPCTSKTEVCGHSWEKENEMRMADDIASLPEVGASSVVIAPDKRMGWLRQAGRWQTDVTNNVSVGRGRYCGEEKSKEAAAAGQVQKNDSKEMWHVNKMADGERTGRKLYLQINLSTEGGEGEVIGHYPIRLIRSSADWLECFSDRSGLMNRKVASIHPVLKEVPLPARW